MKKTLLLTAVFILLSAFTVHAENIIFPEGSGVIDVTKSPYKADNSGKTDATAAIQKAIDDWKGRGTTLYFPNGTYLVSDTLYVGGVPHSADRYITFQGQSEAGTVIKLKDNCESYGDKSNPKVILSLYDGKGTGDAMYNNVWNLTVDAGRGNPGAVGLRYMTNNTGTCTHITIKSSDPEGAGFLGLDLRQHQNGPGLIKDVTVLGFDRGVETSGNFHITLEHITLKNQNEVGVLIDKYSRVAMRGLTSVNTVPAVKHMGSQGLHFIEGDFSGGSKDNAAIYNDKGRLYIRDIKQSGYGHLLRKRDGSYLDGDKVDEYYEGTGYSLFGCEKTSLRLPIEETPEVPWEQDLSKWQLVDSSAQDDTENIQKAFDEAAAKGKTTVCFPFGSERAEKYQVSGTIRVHGSVNRVIFMNNQIWAIEPLFSDKDGVIFKLDGLKGETIAFERCRNTTKKGGGRPTQLCHTFENVDHVTVVVRNFRFGQFAIKTTHGGKWFFDDSAARPITISKGEKAWFRQFNPEHWAFDIMTVDGGQMWMLGFKTEGRTNHITVKNGGKAELIGGVAYQSWGKHKDGNEYDPPMFKVIDSDASFTYSFYHHKRPFTTIVEETQNGVTKTLKRKELEEYELPLYRACRK